MVCFSSGGYNTLLRRRRVHRLNLGLALSLSSLVRSPFSSPALCDTASAHNHFLTLKLSPNLNCCVWHCIQLPLFWDLRSSRGCHARFSSHPKSLAHSTHSFAPLQNHNDVPLHSLTMAMPLAPPLPTQCPPCLLPSKPDSRAPCPRVPLPHPAITAPMRYSSSRQKVPRFCGAMVPQCRPLSHTLLKASAAAASARQSSGPCEAASRRESPTWSTDSYLAPASASPLPGSPKSR